VTNENSLNQDNVKKENQKATFPVESASFMNECCQNDVTAFNK